MLFVPVGVLANALAGNGEQILALAEGEGFLGTDLHTAGQLAFLDAGMTHGALLYQRIERIVVFERRKRIQHRLGCLGMIL